MRPVSCCQRVTRAVSLDRQIEGMNLGGIWGSAHSNLGPHCQGLRAQGLKPRRVRSPTGRARRPWQTEATRK